MCSQSLYRNDSGGGYVVLRLSVASTGNNPFWRTEIDEHPVS
jgi:hypothetical protein